MSKYVRGVPRDIALCLKDTFLLDLFVETGTLIGYSAKWASKHFKHVYTIELFEEYYQLASNNLATYRNITCIRNHSIYALEELRLDWDGFYYPLFWLDAHWSQDARYGRPIRESQVLEEIENINHWQSRHAIIVDDAHKLSAPRWPKREDVIRALDNNGKRNLKEVYDVIIATPTYRPYEINGECLDGFKSINATST